MSPLKILLIDDHPLFRTGLRTVLQSSIADSQILEASSLEEATRLSDFIPDVLLLDVQLKGVNGLAGISLINLKWPQTRIVVLSADTSPETVQRALMLGAIAHIPKTESTDTILEVIEQATLEQASPRPPQTPRRGPASSWQLTARQCEVLDLLCQGLSNKSIGQRLGLSEYTIRGHVQTLFSLLHVSSRSEASFEARRQGLVN